jgi:hypothetical protein
MRGMKAPRDSIEAPTSNSAVDGAMTQVEATGSPVRGDPAGSDESTGAELSTASIFDS